MDARKKEASGNAELQQALEALEKKIEVAVEPDSDDDFMLFGLGVPSKEHEPLPKAAAALTALLIIVESADTAPTADAAMASEKVGRQRAGDTGAMGGAEKRGVGKR